SPSNDESPSPTPEPKTSPHKKKKPASASAKPKAKAKKNPSRRIRSVANAERNPGSDTEAESEEIRGQRNVNEEEKQNNRREIANFEEKGFAQAVRNSRARSKYLATARDCGSKPERSSSARAKIDIPTRRDG